MMREIVLRLDPSVSLDVFLELFQPHFDIVIREKNRLDLLPKDKGIAQKGAFADLPSHALEQANSHEQPLKRRRKYSTQLTPKEVRVIESLAEGKTYNEVSEDLDININNLRYYIKKIYRILGVNSAREAVHVYRALSY